MARSAVTVLVGLVALALSALWLVGTVELFHPDFNRRRGPDPPVLVAQVIIAGLGIAALLAAAYSIAQCIHGHGGRHGMQAVAALLLAAALFALWLFLALAQASS